MTGRRSGMVRPLAAWAAIVLPVWLVLVLCTSWEPILRDGWGHFIWHRHADLSLGGLWEFAKASYTHNNPRLGQVFTLVQHTPGVWHPLITPVLELAMFFLLATLALGRWPSPRRTADALLFATIVAIVFACGRSLGPMLFYRPFTGNYLFGLVVNLAWLVPYRLHAEQPRRARWWWIPAMLVLGVASGLSNEHTGPALAAAGIFAIAVYWRRGERFVPWALAGLAGLVAGGLLLYYAPGQEIRYHGLASQLTTLDRIAERGAHGNGKILGLIFLYLAPSLVWLALGAVGRFRRGAEPQPCAHAVAQLAGLAVALGIVCTLLASPKQGDRLYFASTCIAAAAIGGWVIAQLGRVERWIAAAFAAIVIAFVGYRLVTVYHSRGEEFAARMAAIRAAAPGATITVPTYSHGRSRWAIGDDFIVPTLRATVALEFGLGGIELTQRQPMPPPGAEP